MWECHHRAEVLNGRKMFSKDELLKLDLYLNRPAKELIFLTSPEHSKIHCADRAKGGKIGGKTGGKIGGKIAMQKMTFEQRSKGGKIAGKIAMRKMTFEQRSKAGKKSAKSILQYTKAGEFVRGWESALEVQRQLGIYQSSISSCCTGRIKSAGGFVWRFKK